MPPTTILMVTGEYPPFSTGGLGTHVSLLAGALTSRGAHVDVLVPGFGGRAFPDVSKTETWSADGASIHRVAATAETLACPWFGPERGRRYSNDLHAYALSLPTPPNIVHCHDWHLFGAAQSIARALGAKLIVTIHLLYHPTFAYWGQRLPSEIVRREADACREADTVITVSDAMRRLIIETHALPEDRVHAIHNGVDGEAPNRESLDAEALAALRAELAPPDSKIILYAGRITAQKGVLPLLRSAALVVRDAPNVRYALVGPTVEPMATRQNTAAEIEALLADNPSVRERVAQVGAVPRERLLNLYRVADIAIVPSLYEPFGYAATEAMTAGLPVIATAVGGLAEIVAPGITGLLCPVRVTPEGLHEVDVEALAALQMELLSDPDRARRMGEAGKARVRSDFSVAQMAERTLDVYAHSSRS